MNNLEIIDKATGRIDVKTMDCGSEIIEIMSAAEHMAEENDQLRISLDNKTRIIEEIERLRKNEATFNKKLMEICQSLRAELAGRPEVVFCSDCQIVRGMEDDCAWCGLKSHHDKIKNPYKEFCSRGVRKESEAK